MPTRFAEKCLSVVASPLRPARPCSFTIFCLPQPSLSPSSKAFSTCRAIYAENLAEDRKIQSWRTTPRRMIAPFRSKPPVLNNEFLVNQDPQILNKFYVNALGKDGDRMLTEEVKWLAVTHKSFDHGRRGYNERLGFLGRRILNLQTSLALVHHSSNTPAPPVPDAFGRIPFQHPALEGLQNIKTKSENFSFEKKALARKRLSQLAQKYGIGNVVRWKPRKAANIYTSGNEMVYAQALLAIVGAVALQKGGEVAATIVRERIMGPLNSQS